MIGANTRFVNEGDAMQLNCPYNRVNSWQSGRNDFLVVCEGRKPMINTNLSISNRINISKSCTMLTVINFTKGDAGTYACFITQKDINESDIYYKHEIHVKLRRKYDFVVALNAALSISHLLVHSHYLNQTLR